MKKLLGFLFKFSPGIVLLALIASVVSGVLNTTLLAYIAEGIRDIANPTMKRLWTFVGFCAAIPVVRIVSQLLLSYLTQRTIYHMRIRMSKNILSAPLPVLEKYGPSYLMATLTSDIRAISTAFTNIPALCMNLTIIICCLVYLTWLNLYIGLGTLVFVAAFVVLFKLRSSRISFYFGKARKVQDRLFKHFKALTEGSKEFKLHRNRRSFFLENLLPSTADDIKNNNMKAYFHFAGLTSFLQLIFFFYLGALVFAIPLTDYELDVEIIVSSSLIMLFVWGPIDRLANSLSSFLPAKVALEKIESLGLSLEKAAEVTAPEGDLDPNWESIELCDLAHSYHNEKEDRSFAMGPINLKFQPGELVFIVGGNGSGKTTLAKLILGLYKPESGHVKFNGNPLNDETQDLYRQYFSAVFSDFFLFDAMIGIEKAQVTDNANNYLEKLNLEKKVTIDEEGRLSTLRLSQGQRKRLALLTAYLEDRSIYLFDEWAADQDPDFKETFYKSLLPELKARGKTIIAISHDDHYYHVADRIIKLDYGQIEYDKPVDEISGIIPSK